MKYFKIACLLLCLTFLSACVSKEEMFPEIPPCIGYSYAAFSFVSTFDGSKVYEGIYFSSDKKVTDMMMDSLHWVSSQYESTWSGTYPNCTIEGQKAFFLSEDEFIRNGKIFKKYD